MENFLKLFSKKFGKFRNNSIPLYSNLETKIEKLLEMQYITKKAKETILKDVRVRAALMHSFKKSEKTIQNWVEFDSIILSTPQAVDIISKQSGLKRNDILEPTKATA